MPKKTYDNACPGCDGFGSKMCPGCADQYAHELADLEVYCDAAHLALERALREHWYQKPGVRVDKVAAARSAAADALRKAAAKAGVRI